MMPCPELIVDPARVVKDITGLTGDSIAKRQEAIIWAYLNTAHTAGVAKGVKTERARIQSEMSLLRQTYPPQVVVDERWRCMLADAIEKDKANG